MAKLEGHHHTYSLLPLSSHLSAFLVHCKGVGLVVTDYSYSMSNNSGIEANSGHALGSVNCHSASSQPNIGRWIDPSGDEIPFLGNHIFQVQFHTATFHSYTSITLREGRAYTTAFVWNEIRSIHRPYSEIAPLTFS